MSATRRGQAIVEMSLVMPILVVFLAVVIEFGWTFHVMASLNTASRIAARLGSTGKSDDAVIAAASLARGNLPSLNVDVRVTRPDGQAVPAHDRTYGNYLHVTCKAPYVTFTGLVDLHALANVEELSDESVFEIRY